MESTRWIVPVLLVFAYLATCEDNKLRERFYWKKVDFDFPSEEARNKAIRSGEFIPENSLPLGVEAWKNKLFVTFPQWRKGTAATLTYIDLDATTEKSPKMKPYPNWDTMKYRQNKGVGKLASVFRVNVDVCDRLWVVDQGIIDILGTREVLYPTKILAYDLNNDKLLFEYPLPKNVLKENTFLANIVVDVTKENCDNAYAYLPDLGSNALVVFHLKTADFWRVTHHFFHFDPLQGDYNVGGNNFQWTDGIFGVTLSPVQSDGSRTLYFHPMSSTYEFAVSTRLIQDKTIASERYHDYKVLGSRGPFGQASATAYDEKTGVVFYTLLNKDAVGCWNTKCAAYSPESNGIVASDSVTMSFPNDLRVDKNGTLWVLTDRLATFIFSKLNYDEVNFRIFSASTEEAIKGTVCDNASLGIAGMFVLFLAITGRSIN